MRLTARYWVPYLLLFATISHYSPLFETVRHYSHYSYYSLFALRDYSLFATIRYSGFPDTLLRERLCRIQIWFCRSAHFFTGCDVTFWWMIQTQKKCQASQSVLPRPWSGQTLEIWIYNLCDASTIKSGQLIIVKNKLMSVFHASVLLLTMNVVITFT